nr:TWiK family of potassium channels protein 7-like [Leptinotarsa decemlineata]
MEKDTGPFCYDPYPTVSKQNTNSLKKESITKKDEGKSCCCFGRKSRKRSRAFLAGLATNLGICVLLFGYTLIGSVIFLAIEGGSSYQHQILATTSLSTNSNTKTKHANHTAELKARTDEARARTVESIWDITVSLNILYRDNWTRLAAQEITRFQNELLRSMTEEMALQQPLQVDAHGGKHVHENYEWTFAKAFLYSLTVLTTIGLQEPFYVRSNSNYSNNLQSPCRDGPTVKEIDSLSGTDNESKSSMHGWSILAPILLCLCMMFIYICLGTFALYKLEDWSLLNGFYFCFMSLTTIGFGDMVPGSDPFLQHESNATIWFCSIYIMSGMALTAMCFNVVHDEIVHRLKHQDKKLPKLNSTSFPEDLNVSDPFNMTS